MRTIRSTQENRCRLVVPLVAGVAALSLVACGGASVDNSAVSSTTPAVATTSATADAAKNSATDTTDSAAAAPATKQTSQPRSTQSAVQAQDGSVERVEAPPAGAERTAADKDFLATLQQQGIDLQEAGEKAAAAAAELGIEQPASAAELTRGIEDSLIAAGHSYCNTPEGNSDLLIPLAAGQLQAKGLVADPREAEKIIIDAARSAYCQ